MPNEAISKNKERVQDLVIRHFKSDLIYEHVGKISLQF